VIYDGPVKDDSAAWALGRIAASKLEFARAGLSQPTIFEYLKQTGEGIQGLGYTFVAASAFTK
jgi:hypothetical protein